MEKKEPLDCRVKVLEFCNDNLTEYVILSHRWIGQEVEYDEIVELAKMDGEMKDEIRQHKGYRKILDSCKQADKDGYQRLWVDTCCIDKRSSAELSEAINSMYRWYENAQVCYAYLHDVLDSSFPVARNDERYASGWPELFSHGWTLQEMIAPSNVQFFNKKWQAIGDKWMFAFYLRKHHWGPRAYTDGWTFRKPTVRCSNHVVGGQSDDDSSRGHGLFSDGSAGREYADVVWRGEEGFSPSSAGDHPHVERPEHLCMELGHHTGNADR